MPDLPHPPRRLTPLGDFLRSRRERLTPTDVGLHSVGRRRTTGLRREEVAQLAGMSAAWYIQLEQGQDVHPSAGVLDALARALRLDATERAHLFRLGHIADFDTGAAAGHAPDAILAATAVPSPEVPDGTPPAVRRMLDGLGATPALVVDRYWDVVGRNAALAALLPALAPERVSPDTPPRNVVHYVLTSAPWRATVADWEVVARRAVAGLRASLAPVLARDAADPRATALIAELQHDSAEFRAWWPAHDLWAAERPLPQVHQHPTAGRLEVEATLLDARGAPGLTLIIYVPCDAVTAAKLRNLVPGATRTRD